jgi:hypothetical protein
MSFRKLGDAVVNSDRVLCIQTLRHPGDKEYAIGVTYDTGQMVVIEDAKPSETISRYLDSPSAGDGSGTT